MSASTSSCSTSKCPARAGLKSIPRILAAARGAQVLIVSSLAEEGAEETVAALALGAADTLPKPGTGRFNGRFSEILLEQAARARPRRCVRRPAVADRAPRFVPSATARRWPTRPLGLVAIGASTGGIHALATPVRGAAGADRRPDPRHPASARAVHGGVRAPARRRRRGARRWSPRTACGCCPTEIIIAPGDAHLNLDRAGDRLIVRLSQPAHGLGLPAVGRPDAVDRRPACSAPRALGIMLTGMGRDGSEGAARLVAAGGSVIAQDEASSAVWGMPRAVVDAGLACAVLPPAKIARRIARRAEEALCR